MEEEGKEVATMAGSNVPPVREHEEEDEGERSLDLVGPTVGLRPKLGTFFFVLLFFFFLFYFIIFYSGLHIKSNKFVIFL